MMANGRGPNQDPNLYSEIDVSSCTSLTVLKRLFSIKGINLPESFSDEIFVENLIGNECYR